MPDSSDDITGDFTGDFTGDEVLEAGRATRRRWPIVLGVAVVAAGAVVVVARGHEDATEQATPSPTPLLAGDPPGTLDTSVVRASGSCDRPADCPLQPASRRIDERVSAAIRAALGTPTSLAVTTRTTGRGAFFSRVVTAGTPAGRLLLVTATDGPASKIVVVHAGRDTVFARDYRDSTYINAVLTGRDAGATLGRLQRLTADPRLRATR